MSETPVTGGARCPMCDKPIDPAYRPFCSKRCADLDLQRWFLGRYVIGGSDEDDGAGAGGRGDDD